MKQGILAVLGLAVASAVLVSSSTIARQDAQDAGYDMDGMEEMIKAGMPGPMHVRLAPLAGEFQATVRFKMTNDAPWQESKSTAKRDWIMDGRFLRETATSEMMGQPFKGLGLLGYDNVREEYVYLWIDNMGTGMMTGTGAAREDGTVSIEGTYANPMSGDKEAWFRYTYDIAAGTTAMDSKDESGEVFRSMEITYTK